MTRWLLSFCLLLGLGGLALPAYAANCEVTTDAQTYADGTIMGAMNCDTNGNERTTLGTLLSGEDQTNNLLMTSGGVVRTTTFSSVTSATTSAVTTVPTGMKTFFVQMVNATSETKALTLDIYGSEFNSTTYGKIVCNITIPSTATTLSLQDYCPKTDANWPYWYYTVTTYTSASAAPVTLYVSY